jgi:hypothetical protein
MRRIVIGLAGVAAAVATVLAFCIPGTALAGSGPHRAAGHYVYTCVRVRDRAKDDTGQICINAFMNPSDLEFHFRARVSFRSVGSGKLSQGSAAALYLKVGRHNYGYLRNPTATAKHGATALRIVTAWIADPRRLSPTAVVKNACMTWHNGGRACHHGYLRGGIPGYIS